MQVDGHDPIFTQGRFNEFEELFSCNMERHISAAGKYVNVNQIVFLLIVDQIGTCVLMINPAPKIQFMAIFLHFTGNKVKKVYI